MFNLWCVCHVTINICIVFKWVMLIYGLLMYIFMVRLLAWMSAFDTCAVTVWCDSTDAVLRLRDLLRIIPEHLTVLRNQCVTQLFDLPTSVTIRMRERSGRADEIVQEELEHETQKKTSNSRVHHVLIHPCGSYPYTMSTMKLWRCSKCREIKC